MKRLGILFFVGFTVSLVSCEKCTRCSFTYDVTTIIQTVNGEEEQTTTITGFLSDTAGLTFREECLKKDEPETITQYYQAKKDTTVLDNFEFVCEPF